MAISEEIREQVRQRFSHRCGYCGVHENEAGSQLEIDHFRPRVSGGKDSLENLIYCCAACNRFKSDFWPQTNPDSTPLRLLHPHKDNLQEHIAEGKYGLLIALSETGKFHLGKLRLNRPQLVAFRRKHQIEKEVRSDIAEALAVSQKLETKESELTDLLNDALVLLEQLQSE